MDAVSEELGIGLQHFQETSKRDRYQFLCDDLNQISWLQCLLRRRKIAKFPSSKVDKHTNVLTDTVDHPWSRLLVQLYSKQPQLKAFPLPCVENEEISINDDIPFTYSQAISYVANTNFRNLWLAAYARYREAHVKYCKQGSTKHSDCTLQPYDGVLKDLLQRILKCPVLHCKEDRLTDDEDDSEGFVGEAMSNAFSDDLQKKLLPAIPNVLVAIETSTHFCVFFYPTAVNPTLYDCITYSPAILGKSYNKSLFLIYQICQLSKSLQKMGLYLGDIRLHDILMNDSLWLQIIPQLDTNILWQSQLQLDSTPTEMAGLPSMRSPGEMLDKCADGHVCVGDGDGNNTTFDLKFAFDLNQFTLREYCEMWCNGQLSNYDYLTILNNAAGRSLKDPAHYHIMPWVTDFSARNGASWRDLTKSKYRLNKGDAHLDLMYTGTSSSNSLSDCASNEIPHHVSDFLSEITYFVYMARRTPQKVLCEHVRPIWVPAEYPGSIQRLQEWTPDECIPEFYSDPLIFKSIHEDLPDLEIPTWASCPEDFICKHREALESQYVSERLQHWIDLNFGYKLTGKAAIKSKNVCLSIVDQHRNLTQRGIVQLFTQPHPPKRFPSPWFTETAPRLNQMLNVSPNNKVSSSRSRTKKLGNETTRRLAKSTENLHISPPPPSQPTNSMVSTSPRARSERTNITSKNLGSVPSEEYTNSTTSNSNSNSNSNFYKSTNFIELPKDYNPIALLQSLETQQNFFERTFPKQKSSASSAHEKIIKNDLMFEENSDDHSYTNQLFADVMQTTALTAKRKSLLAPCINVIKKQTLQNMLQERSERELQVIGCLIVEIFLLQRLRPLLMNGISASFEDRLNACRIVANQYRQDLPKFVRYAVKLFLSPTDSLNPVTEKGLPPTTASQILEPMFANSLLPFPSNYYPTYALIRSLNAFETQNSMLLHLHTHFNCRGKHECGRFAEIDRARVLFSRKIAECKVMSFGAHIGHVLDPIAYEQFSSIDLLLPHVIQLLNDEQTSILAAWNLFEPMAQALGVALTQKYLLLPLMKLYDVESFERGMHSLRTHTTMNVGSGSSNHLRFSTSSSFKSKKSVKLYHHSFLLRLIVRFGLRCFLQNFITPLIEAVGGFKEPDESSGFHYHSGSSRRTSRIFNYSTDKQNPETETAKSVQHVRERLDQLAISTGAAAAITKDDMEEVFTFEDDTNSDRISNSGTAENKSIDSFDIRPATAEEALEETTPEKISISDIIYGNISNTSFDESSGGDGNESGNGNGDQILIHTASASEGVGVGGEKSPTIAIPTINAFSRSYQLNAIDCDIGSRKSVDSFEIITQAAAEEEAMRTKVLKMTSTKVNASEIDQPTAEETQDSLQASVISKMSEAKQAQNNRIAEMSAESLVWLSHRLGPVLTSRFITRNLLKMLSLCYVGQENLLPELAGDVLDDNINGNLNYFSIADARVVGDRSAIRVLECLMSIAALFGEQIILLQYFPHISELVSLGTKRLTSSLEGAIISSLQLLKYLIPCLTDATIMERMKDIILDTILLPILRLLGSSRLTMPSGYLGRSLLARKFLDAVYTLCIRIGPDMSKEHLCISILRPFFLIFDKAYNRPTYFEVNIQDNEHHITPPDGSANDEFQTREKEELRDVFSPALAHTAYLSFLHFLGDIIMPKTILNYEFILTLCHEFEVPSECSTYSGRYLNTQRSSDAVDCPTSPTKKPIDEVYSANSFGTQLVGNRLEVAASGSQQNQTRPTQALEPIDSLNMVAYKFEHISNTRHLKGNWLAYWRHEITRPDSDTKLNLKQIKLQSFIGHANSVRGLVALDNENSFISASKDKTVKLWSLRSEGDGTKATSCQFTYTAHKKSIHSLAFLEAMRFVVSCDSGVHLWDPFIGRPLGILDSLKHNPITVVKSFPSPSPLVVAGTAEASVKIIDSRTMQYVNEWRVASNLQSTGTVRCITIAPSGNWLAVGLSTGSIVMLDTRTGLILNAWRPMECDLLQMASPNDQQLVSSSLDHSLAVWHANDGILQYQLRPPAEPAHFLQTINSELVFATTGNRIGLYTDLNSSHAAYSVTKLRSETFRGVLTSLAVLPLNRAFLAGNESGNIVLLC